MSKRRAQKDARKALKVNCPKCGWPIVNLRRGLQQGDYERYGHAAGEWIKGCRKCGEVVTEWGEIIFPIRFLKELDDAELYNVAGKMGDKMVIMERDLAVQMRRTANESSSESVAVEKVGTEE